MFYAQCLLSRKGPLGAVWVAAYCHKRLKKNQVTETDIPFSVDKILLDGVPVITYRVLGYLLLGVVRIYSKKVEYLFDDCHNVLMKIKGLLVSEKFNAHGDTLSAPYHSITLPDRFELDAFDFEVLEDVSGGDEMPCKEIVLKDTWINVGIGNYSPDEYHCEGVAAHLETFYSACSPAEDILSPHPMDIDMLASSSHNLSNSAASMEKLQENRFFQDKLLDFEMYHGAEEESPGLVRPIGEEHQTELIEVLELTSLENAKLLVITEDHNIRNIEASIENLRDNRFSQEECLELERIGGVEEEPPDLGEEHCTSAEQVKFPEMTSSETRNHHRVTEDRPSSITIDLTPESKFPDTSGSTTPEFMVIPTPSNKERARTPSKRKCFFDNDIVLSNKLLRECMHDSSGLVRKRRKAPHSALDAWKAFRIPNLAQGFLEPLIPCTSLEIRSLFCNKKSKTLVPVETVETPEKLVLPGSSTVGRSSVDLPGSPTVGRSSVDLPGSPTVGRSSVDLPGSPTVGRSSVDLPGSPTVGRSSVDLPGSPTVGRSSEQTAIAPETPAQPSTSMVLFEGPEITNPERMRPASSLEAVEKESSLSQNQELDLNLMNEEINSTEGDSQELHGLSVRTRAVARYFCRSFLHQKKRGGEEILNLLPVLKGRIKKESARLFYEILVLKTEGLVDVKQDNAYDDILVCKFLKLDQFCE